MTRFTYVIKLKSHHDKLGLSPYMVAKRAGVSVNTVDKYASADEVEVDQLKTSIAALCDFYGVPFHEAVEVIKVDESPEIKTLVA